MNRLTSIRSKSMWLASVFMVVFLLFGWMATGLAQENTVDINAPTQAFRDVKRARVVVRQTYGKADNVSLPFYEYAEKILNYAGLSVLEEDATTYDATISIEAKGIPGSARYTGTIDGSHWTIATVEGKISFSAGNKTFRWDFSYTEGPYQTIHRSYSTPNDAPFKAAFDGGFIPVFFKASAKVLGMPPFISALKDANESVSDAAAKVLRELKDPQLLISALKDESWVVRIWAVKALGKLKDPRVVELLISALKDESRDIRVAAAKVLRELKDPQPLISALKDESRDIRVAAVKVLGELKDPRAVEPLISALKDESRDVRVAAAKVLRELKDPRAVEPLISALKDEDGVVRFWAAAALEKITGKNFGQDEAKWRDWLGEE